MYGSAGHQSGSGSGPWADPVAESPDGQGRLAVAVPAERAISSARLIEVCLRFGVPLSWPGRQITSGLALALRAGTITLITGPSGSGKSLLLAAIAGRFCTSREVQQVQFPLDVAVVDAVAPARPVSEALGLLTACGLGEPRLWIRRFEGLSDGERFRARLARAISLHRRTGSSGPLLCDGFGEGLHARLAQAVAFNLRKLASREELALVVATSREDIEEDLRPDELVRLGGPEPVVEARAAAGGRTVTKGGADPRPAISFARQLRIERGKLRDYELFSGMHYRRRERVGFVDRVFVMRQGLGGEPLGVVVYGHAALELALRNRVLGGRFLRQPKRLSRELRVLKRLVIHPDLRGCGLGHWLVGQTLPLAGVRFVECLAAMGLVNPVFEKAGMRRVGVCQAAVVGDEALTALRSAGADPLREDFVSQVRRRPAVRRLVAAAVHDWNRATNSGGEERLGRQSPSALAQTFRQLAGSQPVYFIWARDEQGWAAIDKGQADVQGHDQRVAS